MSESICDRMEREMSEWAVERGGKMASRDVEESAESESEEAPGRGRCII